MGAFLLRWRWRLFAGALCLGAASVLLFQLLVPDAEQESFDRVQLGMTPGEVDAVMEGYLVAEPPEPDHAIPGRFLVITDSSRAT
jgi:hypothetical protein